MGNAVAYEVPRADQRANGFAVGDGSLGRREGRCRSYDNKSHIMVFEAYTPTVILGLRYCPQVPPVSSTPVLGI